MPDSRQTHRSFTVRVPTERYIELADMAAEDNTNLNVKVNELITLGLNRRVSIEDELGKFIRKLMLSDKKESDDAQG